MATAMPCLGARRYTKCTTSLVSAEMVSGPEYHGGANAKRYVPQRTHAAMVPMMMSEFQPEGFHSNKC